MKDFLGKEFAAGQVIVYPIRLGSYMTMHRAVVGYVGEDYLEAVYYRKDWHSEEFMAHRKVRLTRTNRITIVG